MKRTRRREEQIIGIPQEHEAGAKFADLCRKHGMSEGTLHPWKTPAGFALHPTTAIARPAAREESSACRANAEPAPIRAHDHRVPVVAGWRISGRSIEKLGREDQVAGFVRNVPITDSAESLTRTERLAFARDQVLAVVRKVWPHVLTGVGFCAAIRKWVPAETIRALLGQDK